jgi:hypothetical protein
MPPKKSTALKKACPNTNTTDAVDVPSGQMSKMKITSKVKFVSFDWRFPMSM